MTLSHPPDIVFHSAELKSLVQLAIAAQKRCPPACVILPPSTSVTPAWFGARASRSDSNSAITGPRFGMVGTGESQCTLPSEATLRVLLEDLRSPNRSKASSDRAFRQEEHIT